MPASPILILQQQYQLLQAEYDYEKEQYLLQQDSMGLEKKIRRGICWYPLSIGRGYYNSLNQYVVEVYRTEHLEEEHSFEYGRPVTFFTTDGEGRQKEYLNVPCSVSYSDENRMVVIIPGADTLLRLQSWERVGVQLAFDENTFRLMFAALKAAMEDGKGRLAELRDIFHGSRPLSEYAFAPLRFPWLNASQEQAVNKVLWAKDVAVVHGPPGTGKTTTLVEAIYETLHRESQVLVCAQSNMAVDWISEKLVERGIPVLRIGNPVRVTDRMLSFTYERRFEAHPDYPLLRSIRQAIRQLYESKRRGSFDNVHQKISSLRDRADELEMRIQAELFSQARVVACTLTGAAHRILFRQHFGTLFIDEAAQALEAACWIAIRKADRVVLAGDHCQLPPVVTSPEAMKGGLGTTLMQRIVQNKPRAVSLLTIQYRMNDVIMRFSSEWFYHGLLRSDPSVKYRGILDYDNPMEWVDTSSLETREEFVETSFGRVNKAEADFALQRLQDYITKIGRQRMMDEHIDIGLISPYQAQVRYLRRRFHSIPFFAPYRRVVTINTVDGFQGQERDVVLISLVRANDHGDIGFLGDLRRMNVAITRARMKLIIIGDVPTLTRHPFYRRLYEHIQESSLE